MTVILKQTRSGSRRWRLSLFGLVPIGALLGALITASPASAYPGQYFVGTLNGVNGSCLDDWGESIYPGAPLDAYAQCNNGPAQIWIYGLQGNTLELSQSDLNGDPYCLDVPGASLTPGTQVQLWPCNNSAAQQWVQLPGGALHYPDANSNLCLDVPRYQVTPVGAKSPIPLEIWTCNGGANQNWSSLAL
jgi:hypothetical protein